MGGRGPCPLYVEGEVPGFKFVALIKKTLKTTKGLKIK
jgi:hypothetical protein